VHIYFLFLRLLEKSVKIDDSPFAKRFSICRWLANHGRIKSAGRYANFQRPRGGRKYQPPTFGSV
jgi:hypothetical protein